MPVLDRYLARQAMVYVGGATLVLVVLFVLVTLGDELNKLGEAYSTGDAVLVALAQGPRWLFELFPSALLIGLVMATAALVGRSELVAMQAGGYSLVRQAGVVAVLALISASLVAIAYDRLGPEAQVWVAQIKGGRGGEALLQGDALWVREGDAVVLYRGLSETRVAWVERFRLQEDRLLEYERMEDVRRAPSGQWRAARWLHWSLEAGVRRETATDRPVALRVDRRLVELAGKGGEQMGLLELRAAIDSLRRHGLEAARYEVSYYGRLLFPLYALNLALLGFLLGARRRVGRTAASRSVVMGLLVGIGAYLANSLVDYAVVLYRIGVWEGKLAFQLALLAVNLMLLQSLRRI